MLLEAQIFESLGLFVTVTLSIALILGKVTCAFSFCSVQGMPSHAAICTNF